jgi:hypothetical protein
MSWVASVTALIDMILGAALPGGGGSACSYSILVFPIRVEYDMPFSLRRSGRGDRLNDYDNARRRVIPKLSSDSMDILTITKELNG